MDIDIFNDWRVDPFSGVSYEADLEEVHLIEEFAATPGIYGIISNEVPYFSGEIGDITAVEVLNAAGDPKPGGTVYSEVTFSSVPASDEFRVDYIDDSNSTFYATGRFNFNSSEDGNYVKINYKGLGTVVKSKYVLNQVSVVPTNLYIEGALYAEGAISMQIDGPQIVNQLDPALDKHCFDTLTGGEYTTNGTDGKTCFELNAENTAYPSAYYAINGIDTYISNPAGGSLNFLIHAKQDGGIVGGLTFRIFVYDKDFLDLVDFDIVLSDTDLTTSFKWFPLSFQEIPANGVYYRIFLLAGDDSGNGIVYIDWFFGGDISIPISIIAEIMTGSTVGHWLPTGQVGESDIVWLSDKQEITITGTVTNYALTDSEKFYGKIKAVMVYVHIATTSTGNIFGYVSLYETNSGSNYMFGLVDNVIRILGVDSGGGVYEQEGNGALMEIPVSYFSGYQAGLRLNKTGDVAAILNVVGFRLK